MAIYVYNVSTGALVSWCPNDTDPVAPAATLAANGLASVSGLPALDASHVWDAANKTVDTTTPPASPLWVSTYQFVLLFTAAETTAIRTSTDANVQHWLFALSMTQQIDLNDTAIVQPGLAYLASLGLITSARMAQIIANQPPGS